MSGKAVTLGIKIAAEDENVEELREIKAGWTG